MQLNLLRSQRESEFQCDKRFNCKCTLLVSPLPLGVIRYNFMAVNVHHHREIMQNIFNFDPVDSLISIPRFLTSISRKLRCCSWTFCALRGRYQRQDSMKYLGVKIDYLLKFDQQVDSLKSKIARKVGYLWRISGCVSPHGPES